MKSRFLLKVRIFGLLFLISAVAINAAAQTSLAKEKVVAGSSGDYWWYTVVFIAIAGLSAVLYFWRKGKKEDGQSKHNYGRRYDDYQNSDDYDMERVDADMEMEWFRKATKSSLKPAALTLGPKKKPLPSSRTTSSVKSDDVGILNFDSKIFQEKMRKMQFAQAPINSFSELSPAKHYDPLQASDDQALLCAIEQVNEEFEDDETVRELAVRILMAFRTRNSVEALSQIALYDLSSGLRSKAVAALTDFDHESVFETILLACADPTREVRAAAARGLFRLNFDRADAWKRIIETNDDFRMSHASRAAIEAGIVVKSFVRLIHDDLKVAYEAFALVSLLIKSGETDVILEAIRSHKDERVKYALLLVLKVSRDERALNELKELLKGAAVPTDVADRIREAIGSFEQVVA